MPAYETLKTGDKIRLLKVPDWDLEQRKREIAQGLEDAGWTADTIERIIAQNPIVEIDTIDEFGKPWFTTTIIVGGESQIHELAITEDDSWEKI